MKKGKMFLAAPSPALNKPDVSGSLKFLVQILQKTDEIFLPSRLGFIGASCPVCCQYFDGTEKYIPSTKKLLPKNLRGFKQMPKVFDNKKQANDAIKEAKKSDVAFRETNKLYEIVPIEIFNCH